MAVSQNKIQLKENDTVFCFAPQPSLPTHDPFFFQLLPFRFCHALCASDSLIYFFIPCGAKDKPHTNKKCMHGLCPALIFCRGAKEAGHACCSSAPFGSTGSPGNPHTPVLRAVCTHGEAALQQSLAGLIMC